MNLFDRPVQLLMHDDGRHWTVLQELHYLTAAGEMIVIPAGYVTDFATIPRFLWWLLPPTGRYEYAALVHDRLYGMHNRQRLECDRLFLAAMKASGVVFWQRWAIYWGVRAGGWAFWGH